MNNLEKNNLDLQYIKIIKKILKTGEIKNDRTGVGTKSIFNIQIIHDFRDGFPILTTKYVSFKNVLTELKWFLNGDTNIKYLLDNKCYIWVGDCYENFKNTYSSKQIPKNYLNEDGTIIDKKEFIDLLNNDPYFCKIWGDLGPIYGKQWRRYGFSKIDQIKKLINDIKNNPNSRRLLVNSWNVDELNKMILPPCHYSFQCYVRKNKFIDMLVNMRSCDIGLGLPYNITSYGMLLYLIAKNTELKPGRLIIQIGDSHIYLNHIEELKKQIKNNIYSLPKLIDKNPKQLDINLFNINDYYLENYKYSDKIILKLNN